MTKVVADERILKIANRVRQLRIEAGYSSYEKFAYANDLSRSHYWRVESGRWNFSFLFFLKILEAHEMTIEEFFQDQ